MPVKFNEVERFFIDENHTTMSIPVLAEKLKVTERRVSNYLANLPAPVVSPEKPEAVEKSTKGVRVGDLFENNKGSISMTGGQASVKEANQSANPLFQGKFKNDIFVPEPGRPSY